MQKELIKKIVDSKTDDAVDVIVTEIQYVIGDKLSTALEEICNLVTEQYYAVANGSPTVDLEKGFDFLIAEMKRENLKNPKRLYRAGYFHAVKKIGKIIAELKKRGGANEAT